jgi:hypothetical protein
MFVMTNLTYTGAGTAVDQAIEVLRKTGALQPRELPPSPVLLTTRDALVAVWNGSQKLDALAADNLFQDTPAAERLRQIASVRERAGKCGAPGPVRPENLLRGSFQMPCDSGKVGVYFTLAPTMPPKVQSLTFALIPNISAAAGKSLLALVSAGRGTCRVGEVTGWNTTHRTVRLECDHGPLSAVIEVGGDGGLKNASFSEAGNPACPALP